MTGDEGYVVPIAYAVAAACVIGAIVVAVIQKRKTSAWPAELTHVDGRPLSNRVVSTAIMVDILFRTIAPAGIAASLPAGLILPGLDLSLFLALAFLAGLAVSRSFGPNWSRGLALHQTYFLVFACVAGSFVGFDVFTYRSAGWIWIPAVLEACFLTPVLSRLAYIEYFRPYMEAAESWR